MFSNIFVMTIMDNSKIFTKTKGEKPDCELDILLKYQCHIIFMAFVN